MTRLLILFTALLAASVAGVSITSVVQFAGNLSSTPKTALQEHSTARQLPSDQDAIDEAPQPSDVEQQTHRDAKNRRYNRGGRDLTTMDAGMSIAEIGCGPVQPLLPTTYTPIILIGTVIGAQPYLSEDRSYVYTEYAVQVEKLLKKDTDTLPMAGDSLIVDRTGGVLRQRNGHVIRYDSSGSNMARPLQMGDRYVLFLNRIHDGADLILGPGFQLRERKAYLLGEQKGQETLVGSIQGIATELSDEEKFIWAVRRAIENPPSPKFYSELERSRHGNEK